MKIALAQTHGTANVNDNKARAARLDDEPVRLLLGELDKAAVTKARILYPFLRDRRPETYTL